MQEEYGARVEAIVDRVANELAPKLGQNTELFRAHTKQSLLNLGLDTSLIYDATRRAALAFLDDEAEEVIDSSGSFHRMDHIIGVREKLKPKPNPLFERDRLEGKIAFLQSRIGTLSLFNKRARETSKMALGFQKLSDAHIEAYKETKDSEDKELAAEYALKAKVTRDKGQEAIKEIAENTIRIKNHQSELDQLLAELKVVKETIRKGVW